LITTGNDGRDYFSPKGGLSRVTITPAPLAAATTLFSAAASPVQRSTSFSIVEADGRRRTWND
jgi:hypothetical protein